MSTILDKHAVKDFVGKYFDKNCTCPECATKGRIIEEIDSGRLNSNADQHGITWSLGNSCEGKFTEGQKVKMRGDMGGFNLFIVKIHNDHYATVRGCSMGDSVERHMNMNCLEPIEA